MPLNLESYIRYAFCRLRTCSNFWMSDRRICNLYYLLSKIWHIVYQALKYQVCVAVPFFRTVTLTIFIIPAYWVRGTTVVLAKIFRVNCRYGTVKMFSLVQFSFPSVYQTMQRRSVAPCQAYCHSWMSCFTGIFDRCDYGTVSTVF